MSKMAEFEAIKALFTKWNESGVPKGIAFPKTQSEAVGWSCKEFGIEGIGSRREFRRTHKEYGTIVLEIKDLIAGLKPQSEVRRSGKKSDPTQTPAPAKNRVYKTQKSRRRAAEVEREEYRVMLVAELEKHQEVREELGSAKRDLMNLQTEIDALKAENASLKQKLIGKGATLQLVN